MNKMLEVVKQKNGRISLRVKGKTVRLLPKGISFEDARLEAYEYVWAQPGMWNIKGVVQ